MNIVFVSKECPPSPRSSGIGTYVWETGRALAQFGHNVTIIAASDDDKFTSSVPSPRLTLIRLPDDELNVEKRGIVARVFNAPFEPGIAYRRRLAECIATIIDEHDPDIIEFPGYRGESIVWLAGQRSLPMVVKMHGYTAGIDAVWKDRVSATMRLLCKWECQELNAADIITVASENQARLVRPRFGADRVQVLRYSIDTDYWKKLSVYARPEIGRNDILFVGTLQRKKGIFVLLRAAKLLRQQGWRGRLILAGRPCRDFERWLSLRAALGIKLPDWVVRLGVCRRERLAGLYRDAGVCCFPSLLEPFGFTCLEAMACGGLVVGSLGTGMAEILTETSGLLVSPGDVSRLAVALKTALSMSDRERGQIQEAAQQRARDYFDNRIVIPELLSFYDEVINSYQARAGLHKLCDRNAATA
jgi:glycosyltransferase involved in cell wall biosynthesis